MMFLLLITFTVSSGNSFASLDRTVQTPSGAICGTTSYYGQQPVQTFLGIPYAKPPLDNLRFKKPAQLPPWSGKLIAKHMPPACIQFTTYPFPWVDTQEGKSEDCLYLNIWAPGTTKEGDKKAVIFWIHGGGYMFGSNRMDLYDGRVLAAEGDVIVVSINYRLGLFGFFTSGTDDAPGNVGLYDMLEALKWVNTNIESFGGDKNRITIAGQSAGSASVSALLISPLAKDLFSKAILESQSILIYTSGLLEPNLHLAQRLAESIGCSSDKNTLSQNPNGVVNCLRGKSASDLANALYNLQPTSTVTFVAFYGDELLPNEPGMALRSGNINNVPLLIGNTEDEGGFLLTTGKPDIFGFFGYKDPTIPKPVGAYILQTTFFLYPNPNEIVQYYLGHLKDDEYDAIRHQVYTAIGDFAFTCGNAYVAESYAARNQNVNYYLFTHRPSTTPWAPWLGVVHFEEVQFVFGLPLRYPSMYKQEEVLLSNKMIEIWTDFVKHGHPSESLKWPKYSKDNPSYAVLSTESTGVSFGTGPNIENCNFVRGFYGF